MAFGVALSQDLTPNALLVISQSIFSALGILSSWLLQRMLSSWFLHKAVFVTINASSIYYIVYFNTFYWLMTHEILIIKQNILWWPTRGI